MTQQVGTQSATERTVSAEIDAGGALILSGGLKPPPLVVRLSNPLLCLPQTPEATILDCWLAACSRIGLANSSIRVMTDEAGAAVWRATRHAASLVRDASAYRGPAGVLRDASVELGTTGPRVVVEHTRMIADPGLLAGLVAAHTRSGRAISIATNPDGSFSGIFVAEPEAISIIPSIGFMDIKEQWIPAAQAHGLCVRKVPLGGWCFQVRTLDAYLDAVGRLCGFGVNEDSRVLGRGGAIFDPVGYEGSLISASSEIGSGATIARSVIGQDARIGDEAVVVRSLIGPGARVPNGSVVVDSVVDAADDGKNRASVPGRAGT